MKTTLRIAGILIVLLAASYFAFPLWIPLVVGNKLPAGFELEEMVSDYPDVSGISIKSLRVVGPVLGGRIGLSANNIQVGYKGLIRDIGSVELSIWLDAEPVSSKEFTLTDLSLPVIEIKEVLPQFSIDQMRLNLHLGESPLIVLDFDNFDLEPDEDGGFAVDAGLSLQGVPELKGRTEIHSFRDSLSAWFEFNTGSVQEPWLTISIEQNGQMDTHTLLEAGLDTRFADREWLDRLLGTASSGYLQHLAGQVQVQARFDGQSTQDIESLLLSTPSLQLQTRIGTLDINATVHMDREQEGIISFIPRPAQVRYRSTVDNEGSLLGLVPGWQYDGQANNSIDLHLDNVRVEVENISDLDSVTATGSVAVDLQQPTPFAYAAGDSKLSADALSMSAKGDFSIKDKLLNFGEPGSLELQMGNLLLSQPSGQDDLSLRAEHYGMSGELGFGISTQDDVSPARFLFDGQADLSRPVISLGNEDPSSTTMVVGNDLSISANLSSLEGTLVTSGSGTFMNVHIPPLDASAGVLDIAWQALDLDKLAGKLSTRTYGLSVEMDSDIWSGFDLDTRYELLGNSKLQGTGAMAISEGVSLPFGFFGDLQSDRWDINVPASTFDITQLDSLLAIANIESPTDVVWDAGQIVVRGDIIKDKMINADMVFEGKDIVVSLAGSSARKVNFEFSANYGDEVSVSGPLSVEQIVLAGDVDLLQFKTELYLEGMDRIGLQNLHSELFGGNLAMGQLHYMKDGIDDTSIELEKIDLGRLLEFADVDGLQGSGVLDMTLPIGSDQTGYHIRDGLFEADGPGRLAYAQYGVVAGNIGLQALENFQYKSLDGSINYQSDGNYQLVIHLEGSNPDLYEGYPIVFTLNISGILPELFDALFVTGNFEEAILKQIKSN